MIIVTGGAGFIGSACVWKLNQMGQTDILIVDTLKTSEKWQNLIGLSFAEYLDRNDFIEKLDQFKDAAAIIHMGACSATTEKDGDYLMENNYRYTQTLAKWAVKHSIRFIYASSAATYGDGKLGFSDKKIDGLKPLNRYGYSKQLLDLWVQRNKLTDKLVGLKFFNVFGPNEYHKDDMRSVICKAYGQIKQNGALKLFKSYKPEYPDGGQMRDFVYVKDCVDIVSWLLENNVGGVFNVGTGKAQTWNDVAAAIFNAMGIPQKIDYIEMPQTLRDQYQYYTQADMDKLRAAGWKKEFAPLENAIKDYVQNYLVAHEFLS